MKTPFLATICSLVIAATVSAADIYVDNEAGAPSYTETGAWTTSANTTAGYNGGGYRSTRSTSVASTATWRPTIAEAGYYTVSAIFRRGADRTAAAPYSIVHADGTATAIVDQTGAFSGDIGEVSLGTFRFEAGTAGTVTLSNVAGGNVVFIADAIHFAPDAPPTISNVRYAPLYVQANQVFNAVATVTDNQPVSSVSVPWTASPSGAGGTAVAFDDGLHGDGAAGDGVYGAALGGFPAGHTVTFQFEVEDNHGVVVTGDPLSVEIGRTAQFQVRINEIVASNGGSALDDDFGDSSDWIELHNAGPDVADLTGYTISDTADEPAKWAFPGGTSIPAGGYLMVWCDDRNTKLEELHANFKLSAAGEDVVLYDTSRATVVDSTMFPLLGADESYSRFPNHTGPFTKTIISTPRETNLVGLRGDAPTFSAPSGLYSAPLSVTISAPGATEIRYTTNGVEPTQTSTLYTAPVPISTTTGLRAKAFFPSVNPSLTTTACYFYDRVADRTIPVVNVIMDPADLTGPDGIATNYNSHGDAWERRAFAFFMNPDGTQVNESPVGIRINGGSSRALAKKSFRFYLRAAYGRDAWSLPWLAKTSAASFDNLVLRGNNNDGILNASSAEIAQVTFFRDQILRDWHGETGTPSVDGFYAALYLNGQYWGMYNLCERVTDNYMDTKLGGPDWDVAKGTWNSTLKYNTEAIDGDLVEWNAFLAWVDASDISTPAGLDALKQRMDYPGFLKWFALNITALNKDWPQNNWVATRRRNDPTSKWTFHQNDGEWGLGLRTSDASTNMMDWAKGNNFMISTGHNHTIAPLSKIFNGNDLDPIRTKTINGILDNPQGRKDFVAAMEEVLNFEYNTAHSTGAVTAYENLIKSEVPRDSARWAANMIVSAATFNANWPTAVNNMRTFLTNRPAAVRTMIQTEFSIAGTRTVTFQKAGAGNGRLQIYGRFVNLPWTGTFFDGSVLNLVGAPDDGSAVVGWTGALEASTVSTPFTVTTGTAQTITLNFGIASPDVEPNDVIFNEYWVNDNATVHAGVGAIDGDWLELLVVKDGVDLRGWRVTNNPTRLEHGTIDDGNGSLIFPARTELGSLRAGTIILVVSSINATNAATFRADDLDPSDRRLVFYRGNGQLDDTTDPGFGIGNTNEALTLLAPGTDSSFVDDIGVDFIAEGTTVTPASFFGSATIQWPAPFSGIGNDDGAAFTNDPTGGFNNDDGSDPNNSDAVAGPGGWIVDPPGAQTGDSPVGGPNIMTPGRPNTGQDLSSIIVTVPDVWLSY